MANAFYDNYRNLTIGGGSLTLPDFSSGTIKAHLVDSADYTLNTSSHTNESQVTDAGIVSTATLATITVGSVGVGVVDCEDIVFSSVTGDQCEYIIIWEDTAGADTSDPLVCVFDTTNTGLPVTPSGGDITAVVNPSGLFSI